MRRICLKWAVVILLCRMLPAGASESPEDVITERLVAMYPDTEIVWLRANGERFISLYRQPAQQSERAVILVHGMGQHADWPDVVAPLRSALPERGWATLSLQMPILPPEQRLADYASSASAATARIGAAMPFLAERGFKHVVVLGYGFGGALAATYVARRGAGADAFVGISMQAPPFLKPAIDLLEVLGRIDLPVLDIYGTRDFDLVMREVDDRRLAGIRSGNRRYTQLAVAGADHYFTGMQDRLVSVVVDWLARELPLAQVTAGEANQ